METLPQQSQSKTATDTKNQMEKFEEKKAKMLKQLEQEKNRIYKISYLNFKNDIAEMLKNTTNNDALLRQKLSEYLKFLM